MANLGDFLGGAQSAPGAPQPGGGDPMYEERKQGWLQALQEMASDPVSAGTMIQFGISLANPRPGEGVGGQITRALGDAMSFRGKAAEADLERQRQAETAEQNKRRVDLEERRAGLTERELEQRAQDRQSQREMGEREFGLKEQRLGLDRERLQVERERARRGTTGKLPDWQVIQNQILEDTPGIPRLEAAQMAQDILAGPANRRKIADVAQRILGQNADLAFEGLPTRTEEEALRMAESYVYGFGEPESQEGGEQPEAQQQVAPETGPGSSRAQPISVQSEDEAMRYPSGTWVQMGNQVGRVP